MKQKLLAILVAFILGSGAPLGLAREGKSAGSSLDGRIEAVSEDRVTLRTEAGIVDVKLGAELEIWIDGTAAKRSELRNGDEVKVHGSQLPGGGWVAHQLMVHHVKPDAVPPAPSAPEE